jgi:hypothetical protein
MESLLSWPSKDPAEYTRIDIVRWWEARRLHFNVYVGIVGIMTGCWNRTNASRLSIAGSTFELILPGAPFGS